MQTGRGVQAICWIVLSEVCFVKHLFCADAGKCVNKSREREAWAIHRQPEKWLSHAAAHFAAIRMNTVKPFSGCLIPQTV
ncbi:hypothetical protein [Kingella sp. (in: b-proteobacteria)]|uniref:hypothetical protein n=1 Tax=Kingella sp. (in: b-proteobacteria) TaxID=2020713 RepID=UPI0026DCA4A3|nr:hypothetical protein [Kingella sp. (in: b-proteobacteria)]MDO4657018.1 hypothetical protein [Kingella sp. (in: b-proteobacteria)]